MKRDTESGEERQRERWKDTWGETKRARERGVEEEEEATAASSNCRLLLPLPISDNYTCLEKSTHLFYYRFPTNTYLRVYRDSVTTKFLVKFVGPLKI
jgi:hypothetical protein